MDTSGKPVKVPDSTQRPDDLAYFTFRAVVSAHLVDKRAPEKLYPSSSHLGYLSIFSQRR